MALSPSPPTRPAAGYTFAGWSGDATGSTDPVTGTLNGNKSVTATITVIPYALSPPRGCPENATYRYTICPVCAFTCARLIYPDIVMWNEYIEVHSFLSQLLPRIEFCIVY